MSRLRNAGLWQCVYTNLLLSKNVENGLPAVEERNGVEGIEIEVRHMITPCFEALTLISCKYFT